MSKVKVNFDTVYKALWAQYRQQFIIPSQQRWRGYSNAAVRLWLGEWVGAWVCPSVCRAYLVDTIATKDFLQSLSNFTSQQRWRGYSNAAVRLWLGEWVGAWVRPSVCHAYLVDTIATKDFLQSLSNFTCKLWMMRGGILLILGHGVKGPGQLWHSVYKTLWTQYRLQFLPNHFQTLHVSCGWWEKEPYWIWVMGSKVKVNFGTLCIRPCGHETDYSFCPITFKLHM